MTTEATVRTVPITELIPRIRLTCGNISTKKT